MIDFLTSFKTLVFKIKIIFFKFESFEKLSVYFKKINKSLIVY
jgi:hypothetical protein